MKKKIKIVIRLLLIVVVLGFLFAEGPSTVMNVKAAKSSSSKKYKIKYVLKGGKNHKKNPKTYTVKTKTITLKAPNRTGYTFKGWYKDSKYQKRVKKIKKGSKGKVTLYAKWSENKYTILYDGNGSTSGNMVKTSNCKYSSAYQLRNNAFQRTGYVFVGWNTKKDGSGKSYENKETVKKLTSKKDGMITLYAQWKKKSADTITVAVRGSVHDSEMWEEVCAAFTEETGIKVELTIDRELENIIGPEMEAGNYPDVVHLATDDYDPGLTEAYIENRKLAELTDVLSMQVPGEDTKVSDKIIDGFTESSLTNPYGDGKTYLAPTLYSPCGLFYNKTLLEEHGWSVPNTWDEMWTLGEKAKEEGIALFTYPTTGYLDAFFYSLVYSAGGPKFFERAAAHEEGIWETEKGQICLDIMAKLAKYTHEDTTSYANDMDFQKNQQLILANEAIFMPNGTWIVGEMAGSPCADGFEWGMTALPAVGEDRYTYAWIEQAWIPSKAKNMDEAKQFIAFLYSDVACEIFATFGWGQPVKNISDSMDGYWKMFYSIFDNGAKPAIGAFARHDTGNTGLKSIREIFCDPMNNLVDGTLTKEQWTENIENATKQIREVLK